VTETGTITAASTLCYLVVNHRDTEDTEVTQRNPNLTQENRRG